MEEQKPIDLEKLLNKKVLVRVKDGRRLKGLLAQYDEYMNLLLENVEEYSGEEVVGRHKLMVVKGGNVQAIST
jgi:small nuclear ribonucleoprotein (snRNP)-like protein